MNFLADMGISRLVVEELRRNGHDAVHLAERGFQKMTDSDILSKAREECPANTPLSKTISSPCRPPNGKSA